MSKKHHGGPGPVPPGNKPADFPSGHRKPPKGDDETTQSDQGAGFQEQDPQRRLGGYETEGEHSIKQPSRLNDGDIHSK
jgi:hypothetical protein